jgi:hypothetical protein
MLRSTNGMKNYVIDAIDCELGRCKDFLFDDQSWVVRYMVADTRKWLPGRKVLIPVISLGQPDWHRRRFPVQLSKEAIEASPPLDDAAPVSRLAERSTARHYGYGAYWVGTGSWGSVAFPYELRDQTAPEDPDDEVGESVHVRSAHEVVGYHVYAIDGLIGCVDDFLVDDGDWRVNDIVCALNARVRPLHSDGQPAQTMIAPADVVNIDWANQIVSVEQMSADLIARPTRTQPLQPTQPGTSAPVAERH